MTRPHHDHWRSLSAIRLRKPVPARKLVNAAVYVGVVTALVVIDGLDHRDRTLRRGAVVQIGQRLAAHHAPQHGELPAQGVDVEFYRPFGQCCALHRNFRSVCESGNWAISAFSIAVRAEATDMPVSTSARKAYTRRLCAVSRSKPRDSM